MNTGVSSNTTGVGSAAMFETRKQGGHSRSTSIVGGRRSGELMPPNEEDEDEVEEVEAFSPMTSDAEVVAKDEEEEDEVGDMLGDLTRPIPRILFAEKAANGS